MSSIPPPGQPPSDRPPSGDAPTAAPASPPEQAPQQSPQQEQPTPVVPSIADTPVIPQPATTDIKPPASANSNENVSLPDVKNPPISVPSVTLPTSAATANTTLPSTDQPTSTTATSPTAEGSDNVGVNNTPTLKPASPSSGSAPVPVNKPAAVTTTAADDEDALRLQGNPIAAPANTKNVTTNSPAPAPISVTSAPAPPAANPPSRPLIPANPPQQPAPQPINPATLKLHPTGRELKVEDALLYLDQVKLEFGNRPKIYNEFLEIMKLFKAQEVDTVGVIHRVRTLFRGYNNLILGFNTFLPEGYKIEMRDGGAVFVGPGLPPQGLSGNAPLASPPPQFLQGKPMAGRGTPGTAAGRGAAGGRGALPLNLNIMTMPGRGGRGGGAAIPMGGRGGMAGRGGAATGGPGLQQKSALGQQQPAGQQVVPSQQATQPFKMNLSAPDQYTPNAAVNQQSQQQPAQRAVEFDHAIMYVTNIKKRFANQPITYHTFLEILHTYQKEQRGIKEVLEQVSSLFADHPDLLREFTFFLPDAVQEQAKERLSRAAAEAEAKQRAAVEAAAKADSEMVKGKSAPTGWRAPKGSTNVKHLQLHHPSLSGGKQKFIDMTIPYDAQSPQKSHGSTAIQKPEVFVYNSGVERQFFDAVKSALFSYSRDGQGWAEFIKTLDMYAQEILSRNDMLGYVERLLGKNHDLFEQFKCIIAAIGAADAPAHDDSWHSVPLSEIDFSRCRRCTPSYRALPRDYPNPPCSERSDEELKVLNDVWVSLPVGSEESYTFRHMRKNQYEEVLFRCEDMRFEIDMCIDGNASTLQRLEKIYDELVLLSKSETKNAKNGSDSGLGGKTFQYTLDGRVLGIIHKHTIKRIYGDDGPEMLDLCFRNPAVALPIVVNRLRQKDQEWRAAKEALNRKWKDLAEFNYYKSLDHRSITWRTTDKRATSTRALVSEIKDRAAHNGLEGEQALNIKRDKAKEEHGSFYEVTMGSTLPRKMDLNGLPKPTPTIFTPHLSNTYSNSSWAQRDAYRIISFALERGSSSPSDKERCYRLWREFLAPWFGLDLDWMHRPAVEFVPSLVHEDENNHDEDDGSENKEGYSNEKNNAEKDDVVKEEVLKPAVATEPKSYFSVEGHSPFPPGTNVSTTIGKVKVVQYIGEKGVYEIADSLGTTKFLPTTAVFCSVPPIEPSDLTDQLRANDQEVLERPEDNLMIGTQCVYLFFRLHQILIRRLNIAKSLASEVSKDAALGRHIEKLSYNGSQDESKVRYDAFISLVYSLLEAGGASAEATEGGKYEDRVRCLLGNQSFELTTMDKLISHILKSLQHMANDDTLQNLIELYRRHKLTGSFKPTAFHEEAALLSEGENMYAFQICNIPSKDEKILHYEFLGCITEDSEEDEDDDEEERESKKRGINETNDNTDDSGQAKRMR